MLSHVVPPGVIGVLPRDCARWNICFKSSQCSKAMLFWTVPGDCRSYAGLELD
jgi:hypothetical protein